jgi:hypothetical protein
MSNEKPKRAKSKKLNLSVKSVWKNILKDVEKKEIPVHVLEKLLIYLKDGTVVTVDIKKILDEGANHDDVEMHINRRLVELEEYIDNIDFFVDIDRVERTVQPETDKILSKL